eukprot:gnl/Spiro4/14360_TR7734_c0_g1_i1.p1 gnl/Spiro4/14360_TR7734_c0_g1~~gnl/Spiro4/14360_TR7734_c0_g1_i1.p1  ORF type:complete len:303 (+),score=69.42 gnl/Spiro4/14360_TR7734_c0_g1_i1:107-1015(+)
MASIIDGKAIAQQVLEEVTRDVATFKTETRITPGLCVVLVGDDPASRVYVGHKEHMCREAGMHSVVDRQPASLPEDELLRIVSRHCMDPLIHGIIIQMPLPKHIDTQRVIQSLDPLKDVDGLHASNLGNLMLGRECFVPCTPLGVIEMFKRSNISPRGKHAVIVGRSPLVGKSLANLLMLKDKWGSATTTVVHSETPDPKTFTLQADILIAAIGVPEYIKPDWVRPGAVIVDVGINQIPDSTRKTGVRLVGDVCREAYKKASAYTPVPGGVGPLTVSMLMRNTLVAARRSVALLASRGRLHP